MVDALRSTEDTENPQLVRPFDVQTTAGMLAYYTKKGSQTAGILLLGEGERIAKNQTSGEGEFDGIDWCRYAGRMLEPYNVVTGIGNYIFHPGLETDVDLQFADPVQGRPTFFPELDTTFTGIPYIEFMLPTELSEGTGKPTEFQVRVRTSKIQDYDATGAATGKSLTGNCARIMAFCAKFYGRMDIANLIHWPSWYDEFRNRCSFGLGWADSGGDGLTGEYFDGANFNALVKTRIDERIEFNYGTSPAVPEQTAGQPFTIRWTGKFEAENTETYSFYSWSKDGCRVWVNDVQIIDNWGSILYGASEATGTIALTADTKYNIKVEYLQNTPTQTGVMELWYSTPTITKQLVPKDRMFSSAAVATDGRLIERFTGAVVFPGTPWPKALEDIMNRAPGVKWRWQNGKMRFVWGPTRTSVHTFIYDPTQTIIRSNIVQNTVIGKKIDATKKPNFLTIGYRDKDSDLFEQKYHHVKRPELRNQANGKLNDLGIYQIGVARQSEAERIGETQMRRLSDRDTEVQLQGQRKSHRVAKCDLVTLVHPLGDWRNTPLEGHNGPIDMEVMKEVWKSTIETANTKDFILRIWNQGDYDDALHGPFIRRGRSGSVLSRFTPAPKLDDLALTEKALALPDGTPLILIDGIAQFSTTFPWGMFARVWHRRPNDEKLVTADSATDQLTLPNHPYALNTPVMLRNTGGGVPGGLTDTLAYFVIPVAGNPNAFKLAHTPDGAAIDLTSNGSGLNYIAPFVVNDRPIEPNATTKQAAFSVTNAEQGVHFFRVVTETYTQQKFPFQQHDIYSITVADPLATIMKMFDTVPPRDSLKGLGLTIGVARAAGVGAWFGANVWRDRGYGYEKVGYLEGETTIGHTTDNSINWLGDGSGGSYDVLWFIKEGGPDPVNATLDEITAGKNNYFVGREKIGVQTWTDQGAGLWKGEGLVRGLGDTDFLQSTHTAQEDAMLLNESVAFLPMENRDIDETLNFKPITYGALIGTAQPILFLGRSIKPHPPKLLTGLRIASDLISTWFPGEPNEQERYTIYVRDVATNALKRTHVVDLPDSIPARWTYYAGTGNQASVSLDPDGTIECAAGKGGFLSYKSQTFFGDCEIEWEVDGRRMGTITVVDGVSLGTSGVTVWTRAGATPADPLHVNAEGFDVEKYQLLPKDDISIIITNRQAEYLINGKFWARSSQLPVPAGFALIAFFFADTTLAEDQAMLRVRVRPYNPRQFDYTGPMQSVDFGITVPPTVAIEVTQSKLFNGLSVESEPSRIVA